MTTGVATPDTVQSVLAQTKQASGGIVQGFVPLAQVAGPSPIQQRRAANIASFNAGCAVAAPAWATQAYAVNNAATLPNGQVVACQTAGTSSGSAPAYSPSNPNGRPLTDSGGVVWSGVPQGNAAAGALLPGQAPASVTQYASAAAAGLTETIICTGSGNLTLNPAISLFGALPAPGQGYQSSLGAFTFAAGLAAGGGNATAAATAMGYSNLYGYQTYHYDVEFYCTDTVVALTFTNNINQPVSVEIDGVCMTSNPILTNGTAGCCVVFDFGGIPKRRLVRWNAPGTSNTLRGFALSTSGYVEPSDTPTSDQMLWLGDSIGGSVASGFPANANVICMGSLLKRLLGMNVITVSISGSGYAVANANEFTMPAVLQNSANQQIFSLYTPSHILHTSGFNDRNTAISTVTAQALLAWQLTRAQFPNAKITVTDGFSQAAGPDANGLALAPALLAQWQAWGDQNSRFIQSIGSGQSGSAQCWTRGTGISTGGLAAGNSTWVVGALGTHCTGVGALYQSTRLANAISAAWNGNY